MPPLVIGAAFGLILTNPYQLAHTVMVKEGRSWPLRDKIPELRRLILNLGSFRFVQFQISIYCHPRV